LCIRNKGEYRKPISNLIIYLFPKHVSEIQVYMNQEGYSGCKSLNNMTKEKVALPAPNLAIKVPCSFHTCPVAFA